MCKQNNPHHLARKPRLEVSKGREIWRFRRQLDKDWLTLDSSIHPLLLRSIQHLLISIQRVGAPLNYAPFLPSSLPSFLPSFQIATHANKFSGALQSPLPSQLETRRGVQMSISYRSNRDWAQPGEMHILLLQISCFTNKICFSPGCAQSLFSSQI